MKAAAFRVALGDGLIDLRHAIERFQEEHGADWLAPFADFYFRERLAVDLGEACALPTLTADAARADDETRTAYETELAAVADSIAKGLPGDHSDATRTRAWSLMAIFAGGAGMARAVSEPKLAAQIAEAARAAITALGTDR